MYISYIHCLTAVYIIQIACTSCLRYTNLVISPLFSFGWQEAITDIDALPHALPQCCSWGRFPLQITLIHFSCTADGGLLPLEKLKKLLHRPTWCTYFIGLAGDVSIIEQETLSLGFRFQLRPWKEFKETKVLHQSAWRSYFLKHKEKTPIFY